MQTAILLFLLCTVGAIVMRTTGFGFGIFVMTTLPLLMPSYGEATMLSGLLAMTMAAGVALRRRRMITWRRILPVLLTSMCVSIVAVGLVSGMQEHHLRRILGMALILASIYFAYFSERIRLRATLPVEVGMGTLSGLMGGFFSMQGPPVVVFLVSAEPDRDHYLADIQTFFALGNLVMTLARLRAGFFTPAVGYAYLYGIGGVVVGTLLGAWVFRRIPKRWFRKVVYAYIGVSGLLIALTA